MDVSNGLLFSVPSELPRVACKWNLDLVFKANSRAELLSSGCASACGSVAARGGRFLRSSNTSGGHRKSVRKRLGELLRVFPGVRRAAESVLLYLVVFFHKDLCTFYRLPVFFENIRWAVWVVLGSLAGAVCSLPRAYRRFFLLRQSLNSSCRNRN